MKRRICMLIVYLVLALSGCQSAQSEGTPSNTSADTNTTAVDTVDDDVADTTANDPQFHEALLEVGRTYEGWGRVDDETRWAPFLCRMPLPSQAALSDSADTDTHGQKLYYLFAKDREAYVQYTTGPVSPGQVVVKQAWRPEKVETTEPFDPAYQESDEGGNYNPLVERDGETFRASEVVGLYVLMKLEPTADGTDQGWVYGTLSADGKTVTSSGLVASCMGCHTQTPGDRIFGPQPAN